MKRNELSVLALLIGLAWSVSAATAMRLEDPNTPARSKILRREIMESQIQPLYLSITTADQTDLETLINRLDRLKVPAGGARQPQEPAPVSSSEMTVEASLPEAKVEDPVLAEGPANQETPEPAEEPTADPEWLRRIDTIEKAVDPISLGDVLYRMSQLKRAERFYRQVLEETTSPEDSEWQWAMYQQANCLRLTQPKEARALYQELIKKAPGSPWTSAANARQITLTWYENMETSNLKRYLSDPNGMP